MKRPKGIIYAMRKAKGSALNPLNEKERLNGRNGTPAL